MTSVALRGRAFISPKLILLCAVDNSQVAWFTGTHSVNWWRGTETDCWYRVMLSSIILCFYITCSQQKECAWEWLFCQFPILSCFNCLFMFFVGNTCIPVCLTYIKHWNGYVLLFFSWEFISVSPVFILSAEASVSINSKFFFLNFQVVIYLQTLSYTESTLWNMDLKESVLITISQYIS